MKQISMVFIVVMVFSCNSGESTKDVTSPNLPAVQNVNGNIPDTSNTINLNSSQPVDSSYIKDSLQPRR